MRPKEHLFQAPVCGRGRDGWFYPRSFQLTDVSVKNDGVAEPQLWLDISGETGGLPGPLHLELSIVDAETLGAELLARSTKLKKRVPELAAAE